MNGSATGECDGSKTSFKETEVHRPLNSNDGPRHRPLTILRIIRGLLCLVVLLSTAFMTLVYWAPVTTVMLRLFSIRGSRKATSVLFGAWLSFWPFLFEKINKTKVIFSGETVPARERVLLLANHRTEVDWMYLWDLALRKGRLGCIKYILKSSLMKLPIFGWGFHILEFISVQRKWEVDESNMHKMLSTFTDPHDPLWLAVFPEGTDFTARLVDWTYAGLLGLCIMILQGCFWPLACINFPILRELDSNKLRMDFILLDRRSTIQIHHLMAGSVSMIVALIGQAILLFT